MSPEKTLKLVRSAKKAFVKKGKNVIEFLVTIKSPKNDEILEHFLGRSGTMRAPVIISGNQIMAGFDEVAYNLMLK